jgi:hypothetical protein
VAPSTRVSARGRGCSSVARGAAVGGSGGAGDVGLLEVAAGDVGEIGRLRGLRTAVAL